MDDLCQTREELLIEVSRLRHENERLKAFKEDYNGSRSDPKAKREALRTLLNAVNETCLLLDTQGYIITLNEVAAKRIGVPIEDLIGKSFYSVHTHEAVRPHRIHIEKVVRTGKPERFNDICDGRIIDNHIYPIFDSKENVSRVSVYGVDVTVRHHWEKLLKERREELEEVNATLRVLLRSREQDKEVIEEAMLKNMKDLVIPYLEQLKTTRLTEEQETYVTILETNLNDVVSPFSRKLSSPFIHLTPKEIQVASLVKDGKTNKEIAELCHVSVKTIEFYRSNIRNKLGLKHKKMNLSSYLHSLA